MQITAVTTEKDESDFIKFQPELYEDDSNYIRPLDKDIERVFDREKNKLFKNGDAKRWLLKNDNRIIGKIAAFYKKKKQDKEGIITGGIGFFDCINDQAAANKLFDTAREWLSSNGIEAMDGPINFGEKDRFWGLLIDGFQPPTYCMNYNYPYYQDLFENYGFKTYFNQYTYYFQVGQDIPEKFKVKAENIAKNKNYSFRHINKKNLDKWAEEFRMVYNKAWVSHANFKPMPPEQARGVIQSLKPILVDELVWFGYYKEDPISFLIMLPELNQIFRNFNGKLNAINKARFAFEMWRKNYSRVFGLVFGVTPQFQGKGVEGAMIMAAADHLVPKNIYKDLELTWIGDFNPKMINVVENLGAEIIKTHRTYRVLFDESRPFERAPMIL